MDVSLPMGILFGVSTACVSVGTAWGIVKVTTSKNSKDIEKLDKDTVKRHECELSTKGCQNLLLQKISEVKDQNEKIDTKREEASDRHNYELIKIATFMGKVEEYIRNDTASTLRNRRTGDFNRDNE